MKVVRRPYGDSSLAAKHRGVEKALGLVLLALAATAPAASRAQESADGEPNPWPQTEIPHETDYPEARQLIENGKWVEAAIVLKSVLKKSPDFALGKLQLSMVLAHSGRREEALTLLQELAAPGGKSRKPKPELVIRRERALSRLFYTTATFQLYQDGLNLILSEKYRAAREKFEKALESEPDNVEVLVRLGQCLTLEGDNDSAAERLRLARKLNPDEPQIRLWLGRALSKRGEVSQAIAELKAAAGELNASELAPIWLAEAFMQSNERAQALALLEADLAREPFHVRALVSLARFQLQFPGKSTELVWSARKNLQLALSRLEKYASPELAPFEGELGLSLRPTPEDLKAEIQKLFQSVDTRLENTGPTKPRRAG